MSTAETPQPPEHEHGDQQLFVTQPGEILPDAQYIDLTAEPDEDARCRLNRVSDPRFGLEDNTTPFIKKEDESQPLYSIASTSGVSFRTQGKRPDFRNGDLAHDDMKDDTFEADDQLSDSERPRKRQRQQKEKSNTEAQRSTRRDVYDRDPAIQGAEFDAEDAWGQMQELVDEEEMILAPGPESELSVPSRTRLMRVRARMKILNKQLHSARRSSSPGTHIQVETQGNDEPTGVSKTAPNEVPQADSVPKFTLVGTEMPKTIGNANIMKQGTGSLMPSGWIQYNEGRRGGHLNKRDRTGGTGREASRKKDTQPPRDETTTAAQRGDPIAARAAMGNVALPGAIHSRNKEDQLKQIVLNISSIPEKNNLKYDKKLLKESTLSFGWGKCKAVDGRWVIPGMRTPLYHHQLIGVRWMLGQEFSPEGPYGGILADQMGLGKTVQILGVICNNLPAKELVKAGKGATLIVVPASTISQWRSEIQKHTRFEKSYSFPVFHAPRDGQECMGGMRYRVSAHNTRQSHRGLHLLCPLPPRLTGGCIVGLHRTRRLQNRTPLTKN